MSKQELIEVPVNGSLVLWYRSRGYDVPTHARQCYATIEGKRVKNGFKVSVARGTTIWVKPDDVPPQSNINIPFVCATCGKKCRTRWSAFKKKISNNCVSCQAKKGFKGGCHSYWVEQLIENNADAFCDISGERDKRFLVLHHLLCRKLGGANALDNYVVLSANYHTAFHVWMGGMQVHCRPEDYELFRRLEREGRRPSSRRKEMTQ